MILGKNNTLDMNTKSPHFWWIISIMAAAIIALVSFILCEKTIGADKIMEFISYSSAILSITLSIFAIQYTYTSNVQIQQQFEKINSIADNIHKTAENLNLTSGKLDENLETILERLENMNTLQKEMSSQLNNLNDSKVNKIDIQHNNYKKE